MTATLRDRLAAVLGPGNDDTTAYAQADAVLEVLRQQPAAEWQIINGWIAEPEGDSMAPVVDLRTLPGWEELTELLTQPVWQWTPEGHDEHFQYVQTADCDGSDVRYWRMTPERRLIVPRGPQERIAALPPASFRRLVDGEPGEEPRS